MFSPTSPSAPPTLSVTSNKGTPGRGRKALGFTGTRGGSRPKKSASKDAVNASPTPGGIDMAALTAEATKKATAMRRGRSGSYFDNFGYDKQTVVSCRKYKGVDAEELSFGPGQDIEIREIDASGWAFGNTEGSSGWFPLTHVHEGPMLSRVGEPRADVDSSSVVSNRAETAAALQTFLGSGERATLAALEDRNILIKGPRGASPAVAKAQRELEKESKKRVLGKFFKKSGRASGPSRQREPSTSGRPVDRRRKCATAERSIFGIPLPDVISQSGGVDVPIVVLSCTNFLKATALECEGLFRISGRQTDVDALKATFSASCTSHVDLSTQNPHVVACVLKEFVRSLPEPLFPFALYDEYIAATGMKAPAKAAHLRGLSERLPAENRALLSHLFAFLKEVQEHSAANKMTCSNLGVVFAPGMLYPKIQTIESMSNNSTAVEVVATFIEWGRLVK